MTKQLFHLLEALPQRYRYTGDRDIRITAPVVESTGEVQPGGVFVARAGGSFDGHDFIPQAIKQGAAVIFGEKPITGLRVPYVLVENAQQAIGYLAAAYHDFPSRKLKMFGVTGTDGKTTTSTLIHSILREDSDGRAGLISTIAADVGGQTLDTGLHVTTPGAAQIQALLAQMVDNGLRYAVVEMTSHGLAQGRVNGIDLDIAVLTNITHEHLNEHKTFENYRAAKGRMFELLNRNKPNTYNVGGVINFDDPNAYYFDQICKAKGVLSEHYNLQQDPSYPWGVYAENLVYSATSTTFDITRTADGSAKIASIRSELVGEFNVMNILAAVAATRLNRLVKSGSIERGVAAVKIIPGRMERIDEGQNFMALVDFAHTPNALENVLKACRQMLPTGKRLIAIIGSAGLRDLDKRRMMPEIAARLADFTILTAEDPRTESLDDILATMAQAASSAGGIEGETFMRVKDRGAALYQACQMAREGDIVIACGKGHEQSMAFGTTEYPWDDREALRAALRGMPLKTLPTAKA
ncbi:MAG: UDP-N-acetylmuramoyl-L-alanyl-D-glutamate--2,6-diaminopimelate ligase [Chloroflexi bacterium]|nr:UDP-N-acetylmuramoyl-L-alanyl-D-glutamate--2,6-diaminopimelate ligase [Chloroflexota bacterium]